MYDHIVIGVDGSDRSERAAVRGMEFARRFDASVDLVHVVERRTLGLTTDADEEARLREAGEAALTAAAALVPDGRPVDTHLLEGKPSAELATFAAERDALLVVGRQGRTGLGGRLLGSVTERVLRRGGVPVLVDPFEDGADAGYTDVLVPTDGSEGAEAAAPHGAAVAARYEATLHALCVVDVQAAGGPFDAGGLDAAFVERLEGEAREAVDRVLERVAAAEPDVATASAVERSDPFVGAAPGIEEYVTENGVDLVVMGSHGRSGLGRRLLGSVTSTLLRTANVPVIVVRRD